MNNKTDQLASHIFICENCASTFVLNTGHPKVLNGDWAPSLLDSKDSQTGRTCNYLHCPLCSCRMLRPGTLQIEVEADAEYWAEIKRKRTDA